MTNAEMREIYDKYRHYGKIVYTEDYEHKHHCRRIQIIELNEYRKTFYFDNGEIIDIHNNINYIY